MKDFISEKANLRRVMQAKLKETSMEWFELANLSLVTNFKKLISEQGRQGHLAILTWIPHFYGEADLVTSSIEILSEQVSVFCPRWLESGDLKFFKMPCKFLKGQGGILEPEESSSQLLSLDMHTKIICLLPGLAFDRRGGRLGRGRGVYDRFLASVPADISILRVGVCWSFQLIGSIPCESHDQRMQVILTEQDLVNV